MFVFDLEVMRKYSRWDIRPNLHSASCSVGHYRYHRYHSYPEGESHQHWLAEAGETLAFDQSDSGHHSDDHPASSANWMMQSKCHRFPSETDPDFADLADAVAALASLLGVAVADVGQASAERLVDSPR